MDEPLANDICSICHCTFHIPFKANCSHWYCGKCILQAWDHGSALQPCKCPLCRCQIIMLVLSEAAARHHSDPEVSDVLRKVEAYNRLFGIQTNGLSQKLQDLPFLLRRLLREMMNPQSSLPFVIRIFSTCIYILSPVDIIPEAIFGVLGLVDDLIIALIFFLHVGALYRSIHVGRHGGSYDNTE